MCINKQDLEVLGKSFQFLGLRHWGSMHVEHLNLPEHLLGAQRTNAFVPIMQSMLED